MLVWPSSTGNKPDLFEVQNVDSFGCNLKGKMVNLECYTVLTCKWLTVGGSKLPPRIATRLTFGNWTGSETALEKPAAACIGK